MEYDEEEQATIEAIQAMLKARTEVTVEDFDEEYNEWYITWTDESGNEWGCWALESLINECKLRDTKTLN